MKGAWLTRSASCAFLNAKHLTFLFISNHFSAAVMPTLFFFFFLKRSLEACGRSRLRFDGGRGGELWHTDLWTSNREGASSLAVWLKLMGTDAAPAPPELPGASLSFCAHLFGMLCWSIKGAFFSLWGLAGEKNSQRKTKERQTLQRTIRDLGKQREEKQIFDCCRRAMFVTIFVVFYFSNFLKKTNKQKPPRTFQSWLKLINRAERLWKNIILWYFFSQYCKCVLKCDSFFKVHFPCIFFNTHQQ